MKNLFKLASFAFYFLMVILFFVVGLYAAKLAGAGKNQMLAGGAIVFMWGVLFAGGAFMLSIIIARFTQPKLIRRLNWLLLALVLGIYGYGYYHFSTRDKEPDKEKNIPKETTSPAAETSSLLIPPILFNTIGNQEGSGSEMGLGFFKPNFYENQTLYFYGGINFDKSMMEHSPVDSITFKRNQYGQFEIATAPPWLVPDHLKLDYDYLYFRVKSLSSDFLEIVVNTTNNQTSYVSRQAGKLVYWPEFLLSVNSVEFLPGSSEKIRVKPLDHAGEVNVEYSFMRPLRIKSDWMYVVLVDNEYNRTGDGWIQWKRDGQLLINYNLLS